MDVAKSKVMMCSKDDNLDGEIEMRMVKHWNRQQGFDIWM